MTESPICDLPSRSMGCNVPLAHNTAADSNPGAILPCGNGHLKSSGIPDQEDASGNRIAIRDHAEAHLYRRSSSGSTSPPTPTSVASGQEIQISLANQYLDTMVRDDVWRAACWKRIRQVQRKQRTQALKRIKHTATKAPRNSSVHTTVPSQKKACSESSSSVHVKSKNRPSAFVTFQRPRCAKGAPSLRDSDSGFVSSSPTPKPSTHLRVRSTRNYPLATPSETISIDIPASMVGRSCLSCKCTNTTCWRRTLGGIICNSCGLRYAIINCEITT